MSQRCCPTAVMVMLPNCCLVPYSALGRRITEVKYLVSSCSHEKQKGNFVAHVIFPFCFPFPPPPNMFISLVKDCEPDLTDEPKPSPSCS